MARYPALTMSMAGVPHHGPCRILVPFLDDFLHYTYYNDYCDNDLLYYIQRTSSAPGGEVGTDAPSEEGTISVLGDASWSVSAVGGFEGSTTWDTWPSTTHRPLTPSNSCGRNL